MYCRDCGEYNDEREICDCGTRIRNSGSDDFITSAVIGAVTDSALLGGLIGGDLVGGIVGDLLNGGDLFD